MLCIPQDRYALAQSLPPVDPQQDWNLVRGENENGFTSLEFWRKLVTCDEKDRDIEVSKYLNATLPASFPGPPRF